MLSLNLLMSLIFQAKRKGRGLLSNGKIYTRLLLCISDLGSEKELLGCFNNEVVSKEAYRKLERYLSRFLTDGKGYPYELIGFEMLERSIGDCEKMSVYLRKMELACNEIFDTDKLDSLTFTLLEILRQDIGIKKILYGSELIPKEKLFGSYAHPKRICIEALLLGLLYHCHKNPCECDRIELLECSDRRTFQAVHFSEGNSLEPDLPISIIDNIRETARRQNCAELKYSLEYNCNGDVISELPQNGNIFLYGVGGSGKTTVLKNLIGNTDTVNFYFPLYQYRQEIHDNIRSEGCWILLNILLKYHYQYEYLTYESLISNEGNDAILQQFTELEKLIKTEPIDKPKYLLLLDGLNEMSADIQRQFINELEWICREWKNVRIVISGRVIPQNTAFGEFKNIEVKGITNECLSRLLSGNGEILLNTKLFEILRLPLFLNMYIDEKSNITTRGDLLDSYFMNWKGSEIERFIIRFALPLVGKRMIEEWSLFEISRAEVLELIDKAIKIYVLDDHVYQNYIAPKNMGKKSLLESRQNTDLIELLVRNTGLMAESEYDTKKLHFTHQYYRDYFAAKHIVNAISVFDIGRIGANSAEEYFSEIGLSGIWFDNMEYFPEKMDVYAIIGEICGDYINDVNSEEFYTETLLDKFLDICRKLDGGYSVENIFTVKKAIHGDLICGVDFSYLNLPLTLPSDVRFCLDGEHPCDFSYTRVYRVAESDDVQAENFKSCDFKGAKFLDKEVKETLHKMGAVVDFDDDNFMDSNYRDILLPWIDL